MTRRLSKWLAASLLFAFHLTVGAEDIDLFLGVTPSAATEVPNVLIIVDNTANWNSAFATEMAALANTLNGLTADKFRVGIMFAAETGGGNNNVDGGYVRAAMRLMDAANKAKYKALVESFDKINDKGNGGSASLVMAEAYRYLSGGAPYAGNGKNKTDYTGNVTGTSADKAVYALASNALSTRTATTYNSPIASGCAKNYIIYISNGASSDNNSVITQANSMLTAAGGSTTQLSISPTGSQSNPIDEWARFLKSSSLNAATYTVDVDPASTGQGPGWTAVLKSMANVSGGRYVPVASSAGSATLAEKLTNIFTEIQSVNSVFASVSLPISVNTQGTYLNQVYIGMFRPDASNFPRWPGNLKQYKMGFVDNVLKMVDANDSSAINSLTGFLTECARSFWTPSATDSYWAFQPQGVCIPPSGAASDEYRNSNTPDGNIVEKGGQAYMTRSTTTRTVKTCSSTFASCTSMLDFSSANVSTSNLGAASDTERDTLIRWVKGLDTADEDIDGVTTLEMRPSVHGDVVHSRPVAINYGTDAVPSIVVYYGGNDGLLRAVNGNRSNSITSSGNTYVAGQELWTFAPPEAFPVFKRIYDNNTQILNPDMPTGLPKPYGVDGAITAYQGSSSSAWLYATMRRGGRALYAFDVSTPGAPALKWKRGCPSNFPATGTVSDTGCSTGFAGMGQTWSSPKIVKSSGYSSGNAPMLVMGGGYDTCEDGDPQTCTSGGYATKGNMIYVIDADSGALLNTLATTRSVVGDIAIVPDATTGLAKYAYAADLGGNVYRVDIGSSAPAAWTITKIASLGCDSLATTCTNNRKFMFAPDVLYENGVYTLLLGSGDREKPLSNYTAAYGVANHFFMLRDDPTSASWLTSESGNCSANPVMCKGSLLQISASSTPTVAEVEAKKGWYLDLAAGEKVVTSSITLFGSVTFSTHQPAVAAAATCSANLGTSLVYNISYANAAAAVGTTRYQRIVGDGLPPSPVAGMVTLDDGRTVPFVIGASPNSPLEASIGAPSPASTVAQPKSRVYWYVQQ
ncbi:pilus assembly protein [Lacisediminimonas sp.]|uniref:pilus assembly protein n=1 Tax=Lacisediminimonas sp. TaxID=3060582 RepID=UPI0027212976|nr:PilC/PilY family type IV pilus protein [Lacisediminimonas sp.]MDO8298339.1 PilC/PilY family type IV pilus protein [Lacisediminimonas sp.]